MIKGNTELYKRLMIHTNLSDTGCWEWNGSKRNGYGRMIIGSRTDGTRKYVSTHRLSYELHYGEIPKGMEVCHKCDNPSCVNPYHLFLGTRQDNIDDRERKGRNNPPKGEKHPKAKLTEADVLGIREKRLLGKSFGKLAEEYGVNKKTIINAVTGKTWSYLPEAPKGE
jgi:hypothetical protein